MAVGAVLAGCRRSAARVASPGDRAGSVAAVRENGPIVEQLVGRIALADDDEDDEDD